MKGRCDHCGRWRNTTDGYDGLVLCGNREKCNERAKRRNLVTPRNYEIFSLYVRGGLTCAQIGEEFDLTKGRIAQIVYVTSRKLGRGGRVAHGLRKEVGSRANLRDLLKGKMETLR